ncbi:unnamed protein product [Ceratitis capitata]|uniref:(Mediterranean fruit fly) hypothetical protein n=1 Tax=Ceratitis capitata TaxID=7213 RepID=A0A811U8V4_CERCA|nr:unnamed protein product [Ceratitis capitata]
MSEFDIFSLRPLCLGNYDCRQPPSRQQSEEKTMEIVSAKLDSQFGSLATAIKSTKLIHSLTLSFIHLFIHSFLSLFLQSFSFTLWLLSSMLPLLPVQLSSSLK